MARYTMREKILAWGDDFEVTDERGSRAFYFDGKVLTLRDTLVMTDADGAEVGLIRRRLLSLGRSYEIERDGRVVAVVRKHLFTLLRAKFTVDVEGPDDLEASGSFLEHRYTFTRGGREVATVGKAWVAFSDTYGIDVHPGEDDALIVASAVVIDRVMHEDRD